MQSDEAVEEILGEINLNVYCERQQLGQSHHYR